MANLTTHPKIDPAERKRAVPLSLNAREKDILDRCAAAAGEDRTSYVLALLLKSKEYKQLIKAAKKSDTIPGQMTFTDLDT